MREKKPIDPTVQKEIAEWVSKFKISRLPWPMSKTDTLILGPILNDFEIGQLSPSKKNEAKEIKDTYELLKKKGKFKLEHRRNTIGIFALPTHENQYAININVTRYMFWRLGQAIANNEPVPSQVYLLFEQMKKQTTTGISTVNNIINPREEMLTLEEAKIFYNELNLFLKNKNMQNESQVTTQQTSTQGLFKRSTETFEEKIHQLIEEKKYNEKQIAILEGQISLNNQSLYNLEVARRKCMSDLKVIQESMDNLKEANKNIENRFNNERLDPISKDQLTVELTNNEEKLTHLQIVYSTTYSQLKSTYETQLSFLKYNQQLNGQLEVSKLKVNKLIIHINEQEDLQAKSVKRKFEESVFEDNLEPETKISKIDDIPIDPNVFLELDNTTNDLGSLEDKILTSEELETLLSEQNKNPSQINTESNPDIEPKDKTYKR